MRCAGYRNIGRGTSLSASSARTECLAKESFALIDHATINRQAKDTRVFGELTREEIEAIDDGLTVFLGWGRLASPGAPRFSEPLPTPRISIQPVPWYYNPLELWAKWNGLLSRCPESLEPHLADARLPRISVLTMQLDRLRTNL